MVTYRGIKKLDNFVSKDNIELTAKRSQRIVNHSPDGFNWGYGGSAPAQLAFALLYDMTDDIEYSLQHYQEFKQDIVSGFDDDWIMTSEQITAWMSKHK